MVIMRIFPFKEKSMGIFPLKEKSPWENRESNPEPHDH
jgi:hypothetical protein